MSEGQPSVAELFRQIIEMQQRLFNEIRSLREEVKALKTALTEIRAGVEKPPVQVVLPPALLRTLKILLEKKEGVTVEEVCKRLNVTRSLAYGYLNRLIQLGYVEKRPAISTRRSRYIYVARTSNIPSYILDIIGKIESSEEKS